MRVVAGADHGGRDLKDRLVAHLRAERHEVVDLGTYDDTPVDYPDIGRAVGRAVAAGEADLGIAVCGTGIGISIAADKVPGVRAALVHDETTARLARQHNDANVVCFGGRTTGSETALRALDAFLAAVHEGGRHAARVAKLEPGG